MADKVNGEVISTPTYVLNGVSSRRWIKSELSNYLHISGGNDLSCATDYCLTGTCATNYCGVTGCPTITRSFYNLSEEGEVYLTTANGVIYYLANDSDEMRQIYPVNSFQNSNPDNSGVSGMAVGIGAIQFEIDTSVVSDLNIRVVPTRNRIIPWRPGTTKCNISVGERYKDHSYILQTRKQMAFPTSNGYFCVQTDYDRCVVFYKGELVYDGEYNGMGLPLSFSYGLEKCLYGGSLGCCPRVSESDIKWNYRVMPKWRQEDGKFVFESPVDKFLKDAVIKKNGKIVGSNIFYWDVNDKKFVSFDGYYADDSYQYIVVKKPQTIKRIKRDEDGMPLYDEQGQIIKEDVSVEVIEEVPFDSGGSDSKFPGYRRFDIYSIISSSNASSSLYPNGLSAYPLAWFAVPMNNVLDEDTGQVKYLRGVLDDEKYRNFSEDLRDFLDSIRDAAEKIADMSEFLDLFRKPNGTFGTGFMGVLKKISALSGGVADKVKTIKEIIVRVYQLVKGVGNAKEFYPAVVALIKDAFTKDADGKTTIDKELNEYEKFVVGIFGERKEGGVRIWFAPTLTPNGTGKKEGGNWDEEELKVFCGLRDEEKIANPVLGCDSQMLYRCWETLKETECTRDEFGVSPSNLKWYSGTGYSEGDYSNQEPADQINEKELLEQADEKVYQDQKLKSQYDVNDKTQETVGKNTDNKTAARQTLWLSRWRNELCVYCAGNEGGVTLGIEQEDPCPCTDIELQTNPYTTNNNCKFKAYNSNNPSVCGKCNYPVTFPGGNEGENGEEPCWIHVPEIPKVDSQGRQLNTAGKLYDVEGGEPAYEKCLEVRYDEEGKLDPTSGRFTHYCDVAVAKVALDYLGGRVETVNYLDGTPSDWGFIRIGAVDCRIKKDYSIIGQISSQMDLPGLQAKLIGKNGVELVEGAEFSVDDLDIEYSTNPSAANAVILRAPGSLAGDNEKGCVPGFADGEGEIVYVLTDKDVSQDYHMRFYHIGAKGTVSSEGVVSGGWSGDDCSDTNEENSTKCVSLKKSKAKNKDNEVSDVDVVNDGYCLDRYVRSVKYTTKTTEHTIETTKYETITVTSTPKTLFYNANNEDVALNEDGSTSVSSTGLKKRTTTLQMGGGSNAMFIVYPSPSYTVDNQTIDDRTTDLEHVNDWFKIGNSYEITGYSQLNIPTEVQFTSYGVRVAPGSGVSEYLGESTTEKTEIVEYGDSGGEELKALVLYDLEDFEKEFIYDWGNDEKEYIREELTSKQEFTFNYDTTKESTSGDAYSPKLCCSGVVTITHKYKLREPTVENPTEKTETDSILITDTSDPYSVHEDTYIIIRKLYAGSGYFGGMSGVSGSVNDKGSAYYSLEENVSRTLNSKRLMSIKSDDESVLVEKLTAGCESLQSGDTAEVKRMLAIIPLLGLAGELTSQGLEKLCRQLTAEKEKYQNKKVDVKEDAEEVRREFFRYFPAYITRPDYVAPLNAGVENNDFRWTSNAVIKQCDSNIGAPSISSDANSSEAKCTKNEISAPINIYECDYNVERNKLPVKYSGSSYYTFTGFTNSWLIVKEKMEEERNRLMKGLIEKAIEKARSKKIEEEETKKKQRIYEQKVQEKLQEKIDSGELELDFFATLDDSYLSEDEKDAINDSISESDYKLTDAEKNAIIVRVKDIDRNFTISEETINQISKQFEEPDRIVWYAKWDHEYKIKRDLNGNIIDDNGTDDDKEVVTDIVEEEEGGGDDFVVESVSETCYIPIPSPAGECYPYLVSEAIKNEEQTDADGQLISVKSVTVITGFNVDKRGNITEETEEHPITKADVGTWFCFGPATDYKSALKNYGGVEKIIAGNVEVDENADAAVLLSATVNDNPYDETAGIKWIQAVNNWGDVHGVAIRGGTKVGDIYYKRTRLVNEKEAIQEILDAYSYNPDNEEEIISAIMVKSGREEYVVSKKEGDKKVQESFYLEDLDSDSDKYWYWNGFEWVKGTQYFSDVDGEEVIFYKDEGSLNVAIQDSNKKCLTDSNDTETDNDETEACTFEAEWDGSVKKTIQGQTVDADKDRIVNCNDFSKAIFKGKVKSNGKQACGDILAVNLNADKTYHKAVFMKEKPIWDRPAYEGEDYTDQKEYLKCFGMTYTAVTYNIGPNKQCFRLWYRDYDANDEESEYVTFAEDYSYFTEEECEQRKKVDEFLVQFGTVQIEMETSSTEFDCSDSGDVPDLSAVVDDKITGSILRKYKGKESEIAKTYLSILSRNKRYLYLFYKGVLIKTYDCKVYGLDDWLEIKDTVTVDGVAYYGTTTRYLNIVQGPKYCVVAVGRARREDDFKSLAFGGDLGVFDVYVDGEPKYRDIIGKVALRGAFLEVLVFELEEGNEFKRYYRVNRVIHTDSSKEFLLCGCFMDDYIDDHHYSDCSRVVTLFSQIHQKTSYGDNEYSCYILSDAKNAPMNIDEIISCSDSHKVIMADWYHILYNEVTQVVEISQVVSPGCECAVAFSPGDDYITHEYCGQHPNGIAYVFGSSQDFDNVRYSNTFDVLVHNESYQLCFCDFWYHFGVSSKSSSVEASRWINIEGGNVFVDSLADKGKRTMIDAKVLVRGVRIHDTCGTGEGGASGYIYGESVILYVFYPDDASFIWEILGDADVADQVRPESTTLCTWDHVKRSVDIVGSEYVSFGIEGGYNYPNDAHTGRQEWREWQRQMYEEKEIPTWFSGALESAKNKLLSYSIQQKYHSNWDDSMYLNYKRSQWNASTYTADVVELSLKEFFAVMHIDRYYQLLTHEPYVEETGKVTYRNIIGTGGIILPSKSDNYHAFYGTGFDVAKRSVPTVCYDTYRNSDTQIGHWNNITIQTAKIELIEKCRKIIVYAGKNPYLSASKDCEGGGDWDGSFPGLSESATSNKSAIERSGHVFVQDVKGGNFPDWMKEWSERSTYWVSDRIHGGYCYNGCDCHELIVRSAGDKVYYTPGGSLPLYTIGLNGLVVSGTNKDIFRASVVCHGGLVESVLCSVEYDQCGLFHTVLIGRSYVLTSNEDGDSCDSTKNYGEVEHELHYAKKFDVSSSGLGVSSGCVYTGYDWHNIYYRGEPLDFNEVYAGGSPFVSLDDDGNVENYQDQTQAKFDIQCFARCCYVNRTSGDYNAGVLNNYVILKNGNVFYKTKYLFNVTSIPGVSSSFKYKVASKVQMSCCGDGVLFTYNGYQCLFIEGEPVYPFVEGDGDNKQLKWIKGRNYSLRCCGYDYYWVQCGSFTDDVEYLLGDTIESMYVLCRISYDRVLRKNGDTEYYENKYVVKVSLGEEGEEHDISDLDQLDLDDVTVALIREWVSKHTPSFQSGSGEFITVGGVTIDVSEFEREQLAAVSVGGDSARLKPGETACVAFLRRNVPLKILSDGREAKIVCKFKEDIGSGGAPMELIEVTLGGFTFSNRRTLFDEDGAETVSLNYTTKDSESDTELNHYRSIEIPKKWTVVDKDGKDNIIFDDDYNYSKVSENADQDCDVESMLNCLKIEQVRYVPWKHKRSMKNRECFTYYRKKLISADPRITEVCCFRYRNVNVEKEHDLDQCDHKSSYLSDAYRYRPSYHAIGAYAIFEDNPFYGAWADGRLQDYSWYEPGTPDTIDSAGSPGELYEYHYTETETIQNVLGVKQINKEHNAERRVLCDVDDYYVKRGELTESNLIPCDNENPKVYDSEGSSYTETDTTITGSLYDNGDQTQRFCNLKGITKEAQKNICMIVWSRGTCQTSYLNDHQVQQDNNEFLYGGGANPSYYTRSWSDWHKNDEPFDELWDGVADEGDLVDSVRVPSGNMATDYWIRRLRSDVIYINDYNAAGRWDRVSGDDPVDDWQGPSSGEFNEKNGGFWTSAPEYHIIKDSYNDNLKPCGKSRLVVSGNNTLYVFDANGRRDYNLFNGEKRKYPQMEKIDPMN